MHYLRMLGVIFMSVLLTIGSVNCFGKKELGTEAIAVKFAREVKRGGYQIVTTEELKGWIDEGKDMFLVDTMPYADSYQKNHIPE